LNPNPRSTLRLFGFYMVWTAFCCLLFWNPLKILFRHALHNDDASHALVVPLIAAWLLFLDRGRFARPAKLSIIPALGFAIPGGALAVLSLSRFDGKSGYALLGMILGLILLFFSGFIALFGRLSAARLWFPFAFLGFAIPLPEVLLDRVVYLLQWGSAATASFFLDVSGVPVLREGLVFHLPSFSIEVAAECSGIRSSIALMILAVLIAHFSFSTFWKKAVFVFAGLLMMLVKNGVRIATLTILAQYVNRGFLYGRLHHEGGIVFFLLGLVLLIPVYWFLRRGETSPSRTEADPAAR